MHQRNGIEGTISELTRAHGMRRNRYRGLAKARFQNLFIATACNIKRWLKLEGAKTDESASYFPAEALKKAFDRTFSAIPGVNKLLERPCGANNIIYICYLVELRNLLEIAGFFSGIYCIDATLMSPYPTLLRPSRKDSRKEEGSSLYDSILYRRDPA